MTGVGEKEKKMGGRLEIGLLDLDGLALRVHVFEVVVVHESKHVFSWGVFKGSNVDVGGKLSCGSFSKSELVRLKDDDVVRIDLDDCDGEFVWAVPLIGP